PIPWRPPSARAGSWSARTSPQALTGQPGNPVVTTATGNASRTPTAPPRSSPTTWPRAQRPSRSTRPTPRSKPAGATPGPRSADPPRGRAGGRGGHPVRMPRMDSGLLHLCAPATWRMALAAGSVAPPSLLSEGFVHLSTPAQVRLPANALYTGRTDLLALVIDPVRLPGELRFEHPRDGHPADPRFPHHYGPVPVNAVFAVVPYQPGSDGRFTDPVGLPAPTDLTARVRWFDRGLAQRRAAAVVPVIGGIAVLDPRFPASYEHNTLWIDGHSDAATVVAEAERALGGVGLTHRRAVLDDPAIAAALAGRGWHVRE